MENNEKITSIKIIKLKRNSEYAAYTSHKPIKLAASDW